MNRVGACHQASGLHLLQKPLAVDVIGGCIEAKRIVL
jgi:hypothetical protein